MDTVYYRSLIAVAELGSFSLAAKQLHITQPAISRRIALLEEQYGCSLLDRTCAAIVPTDAGRVVIEAARDILAAEDKIQRQLDELAGQSKASIACTPNFASLHLARLMGHLSSLGLASHLSVTTGPTDEMTDGVAQGRYDAVFLEHCGLPAIAALHYESIGEEEVVFLSAGTDLPAGEIPLEELLPQQLFSCPTSCCTRRMLDGNLASVGLDVGAFARLTDITDLRVMQEVLLAQGGVAFLSRDLFPEARRDGGIKEHRVVGFDHTRRRSIVARDRETAELWRSFWEGATS